MTFQHLQLFFIQGPSCRRSLHWHYSQWVARHLPHALFVVAGAGALKVSDPASSARSAFVVELKWEASMALGLEMEEALDQAEALEERLPFYL